MDHATRFLSDLGIDHPIIQAPMAGVSTPALAAAVSNAGGLGSLGIGASTADQARRMIRETRALTCRPFGVNVFAQQPPRRDDGREAQWLRYIGRFFEECGAPIPGSLDEIYRSFLEADDVYDMLLEERPAVVSFHFGIPSPEKIRAMREAGIRTAATATNPEEAAAIEQAGIEIIVAQGIEAGGHRGMFDPAAADERLSLSVLVRLLARQTRLPIVAAGGIMDGQGVKAALALGASAAQLGTAFIPCPESSASAGHRRNLVNGRGARTRLTAVPSGRPARAIVNRYIEYGESRDAPPVPDYPVAYDATKRLNAAAAGKGIDDFAVQWAGQGAPLAREMPAAQLVERLVAEWRQASG